MQPTQISAQQARTFYPQAQGPFRDFLLSVYGKGFLEASIMERIKTFEDACAEAGFNAAHTDFHSRKPDESAYLRIKVITRALNPKDWVADYSNPNQKKWFPYFVWDATAGRFRFYASSYRYCNADLTGGSRTAFASKELSDYAGQQFEDDYNNFLK